MEGLVKVEGLSRLGAKEEIIAFAYIEKGYDLP